MIYENLVLDEERALYGIKDAEVRKCIFDGPADGESALKECENVTITDCDFRLRYPFWHVNHATIVESRMTEGCRAALWYDTGIQMNHCAWHRFSGKPLQQGAGRLPRLQSDKT